MIYFLTVLLVFILALFVFLFIKKRQGIVPIRIGRRGDSILSLEIPYNNEKDILIEVAKDIIRSAEYRPFLVCSGVQDKPPNSNIAERDYYIGNLTEQEIDNVIDNKFNDISIFLLNEDVGDKNKILLTHDLIVHSAQIPDRELLLESGFILTVAAESNLVIITGIKGHIEKVILTIFEILSQKNKGVLISKTM